MATQQVPISSPIKGVVRAVNREGQPPDTAWDAINVLPYDRYGRRRLASRPGIIKQCGQQMGSGTQLVQGLIEAPSIIYPPGTFTVPVGSITTYGTFPASTPGTIGPIPYSGPSGLVGFTLEYQWSFTVAISGAVTGTSGQGGGQSFNADFFWPLASGPDNNLIMRLYGGYFLGDSSPGGNMIDLAVAFYTGAPATFGSWSHIVTSPNSPLYTLPVADDTFTGNASVACVLSIFNTGAINFTMAGATPAAIPTNSTTGIPSMDFPELNIQDISIGAFSGSAASGTLTLNITD